MNNWMRGVNEQAAAPGGNPFDRLAQAAGTAVKSMEDHVLLKII